MKINFVFILFCRAIQPDETVLKIEKEYHDVYLASLLPIIASRIEEFHDLLINPPQVSCSLFIIWRKRFDSFFNKPKRSSEKWYSKHRWTAITAFRHHKTANLCNVCCFAKRRESNIYTSVRIVWMGRCCRLSMFQYFCLFFNSITEYVILSFSIRCSSCLSNTVGIIYCTLKCWIVFALSFLYSVHTKRLLKICQYLPYNLT